MRLIRLALTLAVTGIAVNTFMKSRRGAEPAEEGAASSAADASADAGMEAGIAANRAAMPDITTGINDSPNAAERLQGAGLADVAGSGQSGDDLLRPNGQGGSGTVLPGMPDLTRGA